MVEVSEQGTVADSVPDCRALAATPSHAQPHYPILFSRQMARPVQSELNKLRVKVVKAAHDDLFGHPDEDGQK